MNGPVLQMRSLSLAAGDRTLVADLDLAMRPGELWSVLGKNGAGKSTLLRVAAGLQDAARGQVLLDGKPLASWQPLQLALRRGYLGQPSGDVFHMSAIEAVRAARMPFLGGWGWSGERDSRIVEEALAAMDMGHAALQDVLTLSAGERQRVALATLFAQQAPLILLDEPVQHLDLAHRAMVMQHLARSVSASGGVAITSLHEPELALGACTHALVLFGDGQWDAGPAQELLTEPLLERLYGVSVRLAPRHWGPGPSA